MRLWDLFLSGGPLMWPILLCSILVSAVIVYKLRQFRKLQLGRDKVLDAVFENIRHNRIKEAIEICDSSGGLLTANLLKAGILKYDRNRQEIKESLENTARYEIPRLEEQMPLLATIIYLAPLLGMLGTVVGMIYAFQEIHSRNASLQSVSPADLSSAIWQALISTLAGLCVAILAYIAYNYFSVRINDHILDMEKTADELLDVLSP